MLPRIVMLSPSKHLRVRMGSCTLTLSSTREEVLPTACSGALTSSAWQIGAGVRDTPPGPTSSQGHRCSEQALTVSASGSLAARPLASARTALCGPDPTMTPSPGRRRRSRTALHPQPTRPTDAPVATAIVGCSSHRRCTRAICGRRQWLRSFELFLSSRPAPPPRLRPIPPPPSTRRG